MQCGSTILQCLRAVHQCRGAALELRGAAVEPGCAGCRRIDTIGICGNALVQRRGALCELLHTAVDLAGPCAEVTDRRLDLAEYCRGLCQVLFADRRIFRALRLLQQCECSAVVAVHCSQSVCHVLRACIEAAECIRGGQLSGSALHAADQSIDAVTGCIDAGHQSRGALRELGDAAAKKGVTLVIENHFNTMTMSARQTADTIREIDHPNVKILYDQANLTFTGCEDWQEAIRIQKGLVGHMHVKDLVFKGANKAFVGNDDVSHPDEDSRNVITRIVGEGIIEWPAILRQMKADGYDGWLSLEYERRWHPDDIPDASIGMKRSADYLKTITL